MSAIMDNKMNFLIHPSYIGIQSNSIESEKYLLKSYIILRPMIFESYMPQVILAIKIFCRANCKIGFQEPHTA
jgi:hypothetical protein